MISVTGVTKRFGDFTALDDVSLEVPEGSLSALLGPSGSGKSTLLRIIAGLDAGDSGQVLIDGVDQTLVPARKRQIGFVFQHYAAFKHMSVRENVAFGLKIRKRPKAEIAGRVNELLGIVGLTGYQDRYPSQLSGGQRQRMALARALAVEPRLLLLDEPFGALDANVRSDLRNWLRKLHEEVAGDDGHRHARPGGGDGDLRPHRRDEPRKDRTGRHAARPLRAARERLRDGLPRAGHRARRTARAPARPAPDDRRARRRARGDGRSRDASGLRGPRRPRARRWQRARRSGHARRGRGAGAARAATSYGSVRTGRRAAARRSVFDPGVRVGRERGHRVRKLSRRDVRERHAFENDAQARPQGYPHLR